MSTQRVPDVNPAPSPTTILGGGLAGLAFAYFANLAGERVKLFEAAPFLGGNGRTLRFGEALIDTGAHRLHDRNPVATKAFQRLLGPALSRVEAPSQIIWRGKKIDFPLKPLNAAICMGPGGLVRVLAENIIPKRNATPKTFEELAVLRYGPTLARQFLLNYSEKLWGRQADELDPKVAGGRLNGLTLGSVLRELLLGARATTRHLDGAFYYPTLGFGMLVDALVDHVGEEHFNTDAPVTRIAHDGRRVLSVDISGEYQEVCGDIVSTIPLPRLVELLDPPPEESVRQAAQSLSYRHLRLCIVRLDQDTVSSSASLYFPEASIPFTRLYEPKNRSPAMAPVGSTAIVLEIPCSNLEEWWLMSDEAFETGVLKALPATGLELGPIIGVDSVRLPNAYPILDLNASVTAARLLEYADSFENLRLGGRAGTFQYLHTHDLFADAHEWANDRVAPMTSKSSTSEK